MPLTLSYAGPAIGLDPNKISAIDEPSTPAIDDDTPARSLSTLFADAILAGAVVLPDDLQAVIYASDEDDGSLFQVAVHAGRGDAQLAGRWWEVADVVGPDAEYSESVDRVRDVLTQLVSFANHLLDDVRVGGQAGLDEDVVSDIRSALEGDSNDAEHDALVGVADFFAIDYTPSDF